MQIAIFLILHFNKLINRVLKITIKNTSRDLNSLNVFKHDSILLQQFYKHTIKHIPYHFGHIIFAI